MEHARNINTIELKRNILQKMIERVRRDTNTRWVFAVCVANRKGRGDVRRKLSKETKRFYHERSVFTAVHHPGPWIILCSVLTVSQKRKRQIYARPLAIHPLSFLLLLSNISINPRLYDQPAAIKSGKRGKFVSLVEIPAPFRSARPSGCFDFARWNYRPKNTIRVSFFPIKSKYTRTSFPWI